MCSMLSNASLLLTHPLFNGNSPHYNFFVVRDFPKGMEQCMIFLLQRLIQLGCLRV